MVDIFISYSKKDANAVRMLAASLEADGYSVWWDTSLDAGDPFRKVIMTELAKARAVIVVWTEHSVASEWVVSEAGRGHVDGKLIPVRVRSLDYRQIPPPFENLHTEFLDARERIVAAVVAQLAKPQVMPPPVAMAWRQSKLELLSWFGVIGAAVSLTANLGGVVTFARALRAVLENWTDLLQWFWGWVFFWMPKVAKADAVLLTVSMCLFTSVFAARSRLVKIDQRLKERTPNGFVSLLIAMAVGLGIAATGFLRVYFQEVHDIGNVSMEISWALRYYLNNPFNFSSVEYPVPAWIIVAELFSAFVALPAVVLVLLYHVIRMATGWTVNLPTLNRRLWRIIAGVALLLGFNAAMLQAERSELLCRHKIIACADAR